ncbi:MAG: hypothetical protein ABMA13_10525 [Chthoniobacteraceae bacterium]
MIWTQSFWNQSSWAPVAENPNTPMPIQNISAEFTVQGLADLKAAILALNPMFPALSVLTEDERRRLQRVAAGRESFCETAISGAESFPTVLPGFISKAEWDKDENYFTQLGEVEILIVALLMKLHDTRAVVGAERYRQSRKFYEAVKAGKGDVPGLQALYEMLRDQFDGQGPGGGEEEPPAPGGGGGGGGGNPPPGP